MIQDNGAPVADKGRLRKIIRKKIAEILTDATDAGARVFPNASIPPWSEELPCILVYQKNEPVREFSAAPRELERSLNIEIEIVAQGPEVNVDMQTPAGIKTLEDILDDIAEQVEQALAADETLGGVCSDSILNDTNFEFDSAGTGPIGSAILNYTVTYYTMSPRSSNIEDDFSTAGIEYNIGEDENTREAQDVVAIP